MSRETDDLAELADGKPSFSGIFATKPPSSRKTRFFLLPMSEPGVFWVRA